MSVEPALTSQLTAVPEWRAPSRRRQLLSADGLANLIVLSAAASIVLITGALVYELWHSSMAARHEFGWRFLISQEWNPVEGVYGALPFLYGTIVTAVIALLIAVPLGIGCAIFLAELAPPRISDALTFLIELLAAVPSVIARTPMAARIASRSPT